MRLGDAIGQVVVVAVAGFAGEVAARAVGEALLGAAGDGAVGEPVQAVVGEAFAITVSMTLAIKGRLAPCGRSTVCRNCLIDLSTAAGSKNSGPPWVNI